MIDCFYRHTSFHFNQKRISYCLGSALAMHKLFSSSKYLLSIAKDKELIGKLFHFLPYYFREESKSVSENLQKDINLNMLIIG